MQGGGIALDPLTRASVYEIHPRLSTTSRRVRFQAGEGSLACKRTIHLIVGGGLINWDEMRLRWVDSPSRPRRSGLGRANPRERETVDPFAVRRSPFASVVCSGWMSMKKCWANDEPAVLDADEEVRGTTGALREDEVLFAPKRVTRTDSICKAHCTLPPSREFEHGGSARWRFRCKVHCMPRAERATTSKTAIIISVDRLLHCSLRRIS